jgi:hypothetical protein
MQLADVGAADEKKTRLKITFNFQLAINYRPSAGKSMQCCMPSYGRKKSLQFCRPTAGYYVFNFSARLPLRALEKLAILPAYGRLLCCNFSARLRLARLPG